MKIGIVAFPSMGGSGMVATRLADELANRGHNVHFISYQQPFAFTNTQDNINLHIIDLKSYPLFNNVGSLYTIRLANFIAREVREHGIDIINSHYAIPHAASSTMAKSLVQFNSIVTMHGSDTHTLGNDEGFKEYMMYSLKNSDEIVAVSKYLSQITKSIYNLDKEPTVIHDFIDTKKFSPGSAKEKVVVHASNFRSIKRVPFLIDIFSQVYRDFPGWRLRLIGDGPERAHCLKLVREKGLRSHVDFVDPHMDIPSEFQRASVVAVPSEVESFGLVIGEGMACETPVWATNSGGIPEVCVDGVTGRLFAKDDADQAEDALRTLMADEELRCKLGKNARARVQKHFSVDTIVEKYLELYKRF